MPVYLKSEKAPIPEIIFDGSIGKEFGGITVVDIVNVLKQIKNAKKAVMMINSEGGNYFDGIGIYNAMRESSINITTSVLGVAASAASVVALGGDQVEISKHSYMMIHEAQGVAAGDAERVHRFADSLDTFSNNAAEIYASKGGNTSDYWRELMRGEKWMDGEEAVNLGLADVLNDQSVAAHIEPGRFMKTPEHLIANTAQIKCSVKKRFQSRIAAGKIARISQRVGK